MAPEFFPLLVLFGLAVLSLIGTVVGGVLVQANWHNKKRRIVYGLMLGGSFLLGLFVYFCIPSTPRTREELVGTYVLDCKLVHEELFLNNDGTFTQSVSIKTTGEKFSSRGFWTYQTRISHLWIEGDVDLRNGYIGVLEGGYKLRPGYAHQKPGGASISAEYYFGQLELGGRIDSGPQFIKAP